MRHYLASLVLLITSSEEFTQNSSKRVHHVQVNLSPLPPLLTMLNWQAGHFRRLLAAVGVFGCVLFFLLLCVLLLFGFPLLLVWCLFCDGFLDYVAVHANSTFDAFCFALHTSMLQLTN
jgi:hypothetical protein